MAFDVFVLSRVLKKDSLVNIASLLGKEKQWIPTSYPPPQFCLCDSYLPLGLGFQYIGKQP